MTATITPLPREMSQASGMWIIRRFHCLPNSGSLGVKASASTWTSGSAASTSAISPDPGQRSVHVLHAVGDGDAGAGALDRVEAQRKPPPPGALGHLLGRSAVAEVDHQGVRARPRRAAVPGGVILVRAGEGAHATASRRTPPSHQPDRIETPPGPAEQGSM